MPIHAKIHTHYTHVTVLPPFFADAEIVDSETQETDERANCVKVQSRVEQIKTTAHTTLTALPGPLPS